MADAKNCEQAKSGECCYCKNMKYYELEQTFLEINSIVEDIQTSLEGEGCNVSWVLFKLDKIGQKIKAARE